MPTSNDDVKITRVGDEIAPGSYETDLRWLAVLRITQSKHFLKATRLCQFLMYIAERSLTGRNDEINEQQIGVHVFGKPTTYNSSDDTIVRATARQLRQRLAVYYQESDGRDRIKITIPRGGYLPVFTTDELAPNAEPLPREIAAIAPTSDISVIAVVPALLTTRSYLGWRPFLWGIVVGIGLVTSGYFFVQKFADRASASDILWRQLFNRKEETMIVAGDAGLNIFENLSRRQVDVDEYSSHLYLNNPEASTPPGYSWDPLATRTYTTFQGLRLASQLTALSEARKGTSRIWFARELNEEDLKEANAILLDSPQYDPWEHLLDKDLVFTIDYDGLANTIAINNHAPHQGELPRYVWSPSKPNHVGYALITLTNNLSGTGKVLLVQGTTAAGDGAAGDFLLNNQALGDALLPMEDKMGRLHNFQILLETTMTGGSGHASHIIAERMLQN